MVNYDAVINSIKPTQKELMNLTAVKQGMEGDSKISPFSSERRWYMGFTEANKDGFSIEKAPINKLLIVVTESLSTFYRNDRGTDVSRGSVIIKLTDNLIYCVDSFYWYASPSGRAIVHSVSGYFTFNPKEIRGKLKLLSNVKV